MEKNVQRSTSNVRRPTTKKKPLYASLERKIRRLKVTVRHVANEGLALFRESQSAQRSLRISEGRNVELMRGLNLWLQKAELLNERVSQLRWQNEELTEYNSRAVDFITARGLAKDFGIIRIRQSRGWPYRTHSRRRDGGSVVNNGHNAPEAQL